MLVAQPGQHREDDDVSAVSFWMDGLDLSVAYPFAINNEDHRSRDVWLRLDLVIESRHVIWFVDLGLNTRGEKLVVDSNDLIWFVGTDWTVRITRYLFIGYIL